MNNVCFAGDQPAEALERLRALVDRVAWVRGNTDRTITTPCNAEMLEKFTELGL